MHERRVSVAKKGASLIRITLTTESLALQGREEVS